MRSSLFDNFSTRFIANVSWSVGAEFIAKIVRIASLFALAWALPIAQYGVAMLALAFIDILRLLMRCSAGAQVIQCSTTEFKQTLFNGVGLQWILCVGLMAVQILLGWLAAAFYNQPLLFDLLLWSSPVFLGFPIVCSRVFVITRNNQLRIISTVTAIALSLENASVAVSAFAGAGVYAIVIGKFVFTIVWIIAFLRQPAPALDGHFELSKMCSMFIASTKIALSESARAIKLHIDLLVAGKLMTPEFVGIYSVARNASSGVTQSFLMAFENALYPYLCKLNRAGQSHKFAKMLAVLSVVLTLGLTLQAALVPFYLPILFGEKWSMSISAATWLCVAMIPSAILSMVCTSVRAKAQYSLEIALRLTGTFSVLSWLVVVQANNADAFAQATLSGNALGFVAGLIVIAVYVTLISAPMRKEKPYDI